MKLRVIIAVAVLGLVLPAQASEPGEPLGGCEDWVIVHPDITCETLFPYPCVDDDPALPTPQVCTVATNNDTDNEGWVLHVEHSLLGEFDCGGTPRNLYRHRVIRRHETSYEVIAYIDERCGIPGCSDEVSFGIVFNQITGMLHSVVRSRANGPNCDSDYPYLANSRHITFDGLATLFEVLQSYQPPSTISFRVPYMPEGMQAADYFDTYYGTLAAVGDWSQAHPLQCGYPSTPPAVGDYLEVTDTLPTPAPGQGYYYVTAATFVGETRYGRRAERGVLSGRDPVLLPPCNMD